MKTTQISVRFEDPLLNRIAGPPKSDYADHQLRLKDQEHEARLDAPNYDLPTWQTMQGKKAAGELKNEVWLTTQQAEAVNGIADAESAAKALESTQDTGLIANGPGIRRDTRTTLSNEQTVIDRTEDDIAKAEADRNHLEDILAAKVVDSEGISWPGEVPAKPSPDTTHAAITRSAINIKAKLLDWAPFIGLGLVDGVIMVNNIKDYLRRDDYLLPVALSVAFLGLLIILPSFIGKSLARVVRRGTILTNEIVSLPLMTACWLAAVAGSVYLRVSFDISEAIRRAAEAASVPPADIILSDVYNLGMGIFTWTMAVAAVGVIVIVVEVFLHNPITSQILRADHNLVNLYTTRNTHQVVVDKAIAMVKASIQAAQDAIENWRQYKDEILPAQADECDEHYRGWLVRQYDNPAYTTAIMGRSLSPRVSRVAVPAGV